MQTIINNDLKQYIDDLQESGFEAKIDNARGSNLASSAKLLIRHPDAYEIWCYTVLERIYTSGHMYKHTIKCEAVLDPRTHPLTATQAKYYIGELTKVSNRHWRYNCNVPMLYYTLSTRAPGKYKSLFPTAAEIKRLEDLCEEILSL